MWKGLAGSAVAGAGLYAARRYYRNWGTTKDECESPLPGDELVPEPVLQTTEGVWIEATAEEVAVAGPDGPGPRRACTAT